ncbi:MAG: ParB/RepB/Spo0J family partition protein [Chlorobium sp.]|nr:ParB/RepB/Spo0J family partition protein [Chlorobium sp.]
MATQALTPSPATTQIPVANSQPASNDRSNDQSNDQEVTTMAILTENLAPATSQLSAANSQSVSVSFDTEASFNPNTLYSLALKDVKVDADNYGRNLAADDARIIELAKNIGKFGLLQPILVRKGSEGFMVVAGERRYHAAIVAGLDSIPAMFRDENPALISLIENLQRVDLTGIQKAESIARLQLSDPKLYTPKYLSGMIGKNVVTLTAELKLATLPVEVRDKYRSNIKCNCTLLIAARQAYNSSQSKLGVESTPEKYAAGLIEYIDSILDAGLNSSQLHKKLAASSVKAKAAVVPPATIPSDDEKSDNVDELVDQDSENDSVPGGTHEFFNADVPPVFTAIETETQADAAVASVKVLRDLVIGSVSGFDLEHRQTIASLLKEILALVE